jgi:hypothetical protein
MFLSNVDLERAPGAISPAKRADAIQRLKSLLSQFEGPRPEKKAPDGSGS